MDSTTAPAEHFGYDRELLAKFRSTFRGAVASPIEARQFLTELTASAVEAVFEKVRDEAEK